MCQTEAQRELPRREREEESLTECMSTKQSIASSERRTKTHDNVRALYSFTPSLVNVEGFVKRYHCFLAEVEIESHSIY